MRWVAVMVLAQKWRILSRFKAMDDKITIYPELGLQWYNDKYNNYYYAYDVYIFACVYDVDSPDFL